MAKKTKKPARAKRVEFKPFKKLPLELRMMIVEFALPGPRIVTIRREQIKSEKGRFAGWKPVGASYEVPTMLHVNQETRSTALRVYDAAFAGRLHGKPVYFDFAKDCLMFQDTGSMMEFYGNTDWRTFEQNSGPCALEKPLLVLAFFKDVWINNLTPELLRYLGAPKHVSWVRNRGAIVWNHTSAVADLARAFEKAKGDDREVCQSYTLPQVTVKKRKELQTMLNEMNDPSLIVLPKPKKVRVPRPAGPRVPTRRSQRIEELDPLSYEEHTLEDEEILEDEEVLEWEDEVQDEENMQDTEAHECG